MSREELLERAVQYRMTAQAMQTLTLRLAMCLPDVPPEELLRTPSVQVPTDLVRQLRAHTARQQSMYNDLLAETLRLAHNRATQETYQ